MTGLNITYGISFASILLGFAALLTQKKYLDAKTRRITEVELPFLGKLRSNYPAAVFVFLGFALVFWTFHKSYPPRKTEWRIQGSLKHPENKKLDWSKGVMALVPSEIRVCVSDQGRFEIVAMIEEGKAFEEVYETIDFTHPAGSIQLNLQKELQSHRNGERTLLSSLTEHTRSFQPLPITLYEQEEE